MHKSYSICRRSQTCLFISHSFCILSRCQLLIFSMLVVLFPSSHCVADSDIQILFGSYILMGFSVVILYVLWTGHLAKRFLSSSLRFPIILLNFYYDFNVVVLAFMRKQFIAAKRNFRLQKQQKPFLYSPKKKTKNMSSMFANVHNRKFFLKIFYFEIVRFSGKNECSYDSPPLCLADSV